MPNYRVGDIGFTTIAGPLGVAVNIGQALIGDSCRYTHVFMVVSSDGDIIQAMPTGVWTGKVPEGAKMVRPGRLTFDQQVSILGEAARLLSQQPKYSFVNYLSLALLHWGVRPEWLKRYVARSKRMICSQLVDHLLTNAGVQVFDDGRLAQDVTPGDLYYRFVGGEQ